MYAGVEAQFLIGPSPADEAVLINSMHTLSCRRGPDGATGLISWEHSLPGSTGRSTLFIGEDKQELNPRYDNFAIDPANLYDLIITNMAIEDEGTFYCRNLADGSSVTSVVRTVEVAGNPPEMTPHTGGVVTVIEGDTSAIVCTGIGYRPVVTIEWYHTKSGGQESQITDGVTQTEDPNAGDSDLFDVVSTLQYIADKEYNGGELECITTGQSAAPSQENISSLNVQYTPIVNVQYGSDEVRCSSDANPEVAEPYGYKIIINNTNVYTPTPACVDGVCTLPLEVDYDTDVRCNATNGIGMGTDTTVARPGRYNVHRF
ncbi:cell adhesion molecule 1-like [Amphiura filiformis]|uniref:cell adhesion molecule 1-like n=1 Tax=Amphiura filiformis TaxID=82378 RepID=UPI003B220C05